MYVIGFTWGWSLLNPNEPTMVAMMMAVVAQVVLLFFRSLTRPIVPLAIVPARITSESELTSDSERQAAVRSLLDVLPVVNHQMLSRLLNLVAALQKLPVATAFSEQQLASSLGPLLCYDSTSDKSDTRVAKRVMMLLLVEYRQML